MTRIVIKPPKRGPKRRPAPPNRAPINPGQTPPIGGPNVPGGPTPWGTFWPGGSPGEIVVTNPQTPNDVSTGYGDPSTANGSSGNLGKQFGTGAGGGGGVNPIGGDPLAAYEALFTKSTKRIGRSKSDKGRSPIF